MSNIDPSKPEQGQATTASVRDNFQAAATEIDANAAAIAVNTGNIATNLATNNAQDGRLNGIDAEQITQNGRLSANETNIGNNAAAAAAAQGTADTAQGTADTALANAATADGKAVAAQGTADGAVSVNTTQDGRLAGIDTEQVTQNNRITALENVPPAAVEFPVGAYMMGFDPTGVFPGVWAAVPEGTFLMSTIGGADPAGGSNDAAVIDHGHGVTDPGHGHAVGDPGHVHGTNAGGDVTTSPTEFDIVGGGPETDLPVKSAVTGISVTAGPTGITVNNTGASGTNLNRPKYIGVSVYQRTS